MSVMQNKNTGKFVACSKGWANARPSHRHFVRVENDDFIHWPEPEVAIRHANDSIGPKSYGINTSHYGSSYIVLLHSYKKTGNETIDIQLTINHENKNWIHVANKETFIPVGAVGTLNNGMLFTAPSINHSDKRQNYYGAWDGQHDIKEHKSGIDLATLRNNGFVSLYATVWEHITTYPIKDTSGYLLVNINATGGPMPAELLNENGKPISEYTLNESVPIHSDEISVPVQWENHIKLPEQAYSIRFH